MKGFRQSGRRVVALVCLVMSLAAGEAVAGGADRARASELFVQGNRLFKRGLYLDALKKFRQAQKLFPSHKIDLNIGSTLDALGRRTEAAAYFERFLVQASSAPEKITKLARKRLEQLKRKLGSVRLTCLEEGAVVRVDGKSVGRTPLDLPIYLEPGEHRVELLKERFAPFSRAVTIKAGEHGTLDAAKTDGPNKDAASKDLGNTDGPQPSDGAKQCDTKSLADGVGTCNKGCFIDGKCYASGEPTGDLYKTCNPTFSRYHWYPKPGGVVTFAGGGKAGYLNGPAYKALFSEPSSIVVDDAGTVYVADAKNCVVRMISNGVVRTIGKPPVSTVVTCGYVDGSFNTAQFNTPTDLALGKGGEVFVTDSNNDVIRLIKCGQVSTFAGTGNCGFVDHSTDPKQAKLCTPVGIVGDGVSALYITEYSNQMVRKVTQSSVTRVAGADWVKNTPQTGYQDGIGKNAMFNELDDIVALPSGLLLVASRGNHVIRQINPVSGEVKLFAGTKPTGAAAKVTTYPGCVDNPDPLKAKLNSPEALAYDSTHKRVYFWGAQNNCLRMVQLPGKAVSSLNGGCHQSGIGSACSYVYTDGKLSNAGFSGPEGLFVDKAGLLWVADTGYNAIRVINPN